MKPSLLKTLFHHQGSVDNKQFLYGLTIISFCTFTILNIEFAHTGLNMTDSWHWISFHELTFQYIPVLPLRFIIFYLSIVLSIKRVRSIGADKRLGVLLGILTFLFFITIIYLPNISLFLLKPFAKSQIFEYEEYNTQIYAVAIKYAIFLIIGLAGIIYLLVAPSADKKLPHKMSHSFLTSAGKLNDFSYISHFGLLFLVCILVGVIFGGGALWFRTNHEVRNILLGMASIPLVILAVLHVLISMRRARDIGLKGNSIPLGLFIYLLIWLGVGLCHYFEFLPVIKLPIDFIVFFTVHNLYSLQILLFVYPSKPEGGQVPNPFSSHPIRDEKVIA